VWPGGDWDQGRDQEQAIGKRNIGSGKRFGTWRRTECEREHERSKGWTVEKKCNFWSERVSNQLPLDGETGSLPCELFCLWTWRGLLDIGMRVGGTDSR